MLNFLIFAAIIIVILRELIYEYRGINNNNFAGFLYYGEALSKMAKDDHQKADVGNARAFAEWSKAKR